MKQTGSSEAANRSGTRDVELGSSGRCSKLLHFAVVAFRQPSVSFPCIWVSRLHCGFPLLLRSFGVILYFTHTLAPYAPVLARPASR